MSMKVNTAVGLGVRARTVWTACLVFGLMALAFLCSAQPGRALGPEGVLPTINLPESRDEPFEELEEAGECEIREQEAEENEVDPEEECEEFEEEGEGGSQPPPECFLRTASARIFTHSTRDQVSLVIGYTSFSPANVTVGYRLKGGKGGLNLGKTTHHFSKQGVFRVTSKLNDSQMEKVKAAKDFDVRILIPSAPGYCHSYYTRHLSTKRKVHGQVVWYQSEPVYGESE